jgi:hypothetical protein
MAPLSRMLETDILALRLTSRDARDGDKAELAFPAASSNSRMRGTMNTYTMVTSRNALKLANSDLFPIGRAAETQVG